MVIGGGGGGGDAGRRPFEGDLGGIRLWLLPPRRPSRHFQMVYMNMQICRARQKLLLAIFTLQGVFNMQMRKSCHVKQRFFFAGTPFLNLAHAFSPERLRDIIDKSKGWLFAQFCD